MDQQLRMKLNQVKHKKIYKLSSPDCSRPNVSKNFFSFFSRIKFRNFCFICAILQHRHLPLSKCFNLLNIFIIFWSANYSDTFEAYYNRCSKSNEFTNVCSSVNLVLTHLLSSKVDIIDFNKSSSEPKVLSA